MRCKHCLRIAATCESIGRRKQGGSRSRVGWVVASNFWRAKSFRCPRVLYT